jgi:hypothetical protein
MEKKVISDAARSLFAGLVPQDSEQSPRFVWINNYEAERFWAKSNTAQLPKISQPDEVILVNRMEEMGLFLTAHSDILLLREPCDAAFLDYLVELGYQLPTILIVNPSDKITPISEAILASEKVCNSLKALSESSPRCFLTPYAMTDREEEIQRKTGLKSIWPSAAICAKINSKIYSRMISRQLGLRTVDGFECESLESLTAAFRELTVKQTSERILVLKEAMGVSGKGMLMVESQAKFDSTLRFLKRKINVETEVSFVLEVWVDKIKDINYQIFISRTGEVQLLSVKEILTERGVHLGHYFPARLTAEQLDCYREAAEIVGKRLFSDGYFGLAGIDSIIDREGAVYPLLEINARLNMSSYQLNLDKMIAPTSKALAKHYKFLQERPMSFESLLDRMSHHLFTPGLNTSGVLFQTFAGVNVNYDPTSGKSFKGRLYVLLIGDTQQELEQLDLKLTAVLSQLGARPQTAHNSPAG